MRFFIDECLSPVLAQRLNATGAHDATHPRDYGRLGERDDTILRRCIEEDRIIVTENARENPNRTSGGRAFFNLASHRRARSAFWENQCARHHSQGR